MRFVAQKAPDQSSLSRSEKPFTTYNFLIIKLVQCGHKLWMSFSVLVILVKGNDIYSPLITVAHNRSAEIDFNRINLEITCLNAFG